jgi:hypothetical protein
MADKQDIRENAMSGGTPTRLRGLAANGNSISPTLEEVMNAMGIYTYSFTLAAKEEKDLGDLGYGMYLLASPNNAATAIFACRNVYKYQELSGDLCCHRALFLCPFSRLWKQLLLLSRDVSGKL